jgi:hypothetical protein
MINLSPLQPGVHIVAIALPGFSEAQTEGPGPKTGRFFKLKIWTWQGIRKWQDGRSTMDASNSVNSVDGHETSLWPFLFSR